MNSRLRSTRRKQRNRQTLLRCIMLMSVFGLLLAVELLQKDLEPVSGADNINVETQPTETETPVVVEEKHVIEVPSTSIKETESNIDESEEKDVCNDSYVTELLISSGPGYNRLIDTMDDTVIKYTEEIGPKYGIDACLLQAIIFYESSNRQDVSNGTCVGLMQVSTKWHTERAERLGVSLYDAYGNIVTGADYLAELIKEYGDLHTALMVYHGESDALTKAANGEISEYTLNILDLYYRLLDVNHGQRS